jgi:hypothetical protein
LLRSCRWLAGRGRALCGGWIGGETLYLSLELLNLLLQPGHLLLERFDLRRLLALRLRERHSSQKKGEAADRQNSDEEPDHTHAPAQFVNFNGAERQIR